MAKHFSEQSQGASHRGTSRGADARERIVSAAMGMIDRSGAESFAVKDLCAELGVTQSLVNYHFSGRGGLVSSVISRALDDLRAALPLPDPSRSRHATYAAVLASAINWGHRHPGLLAAMVLRFTDNFTTDVRPDITDDLREAWRNLEDECARLVDRSPSDGLHLLWILLGSMGWLTFPGLGREAHEQARARLPMTENHLVDVLVIAFNRPASFIEPFELPINQHHDNPTRSARESLIVAAANLMTSLDGRSISARTVCAEADCAPSLVTYHFGTFEALVVEAATRIFVNGARSAVRISRSGGDPIVNVGHWLAAVTAATAGAVALPIALGSTAHRMRLAENGGGHLENELRDAWISVIGSTAHLATSLLRLDTTQWSGSLDDFDPTASLLSTMSFVGLTGLGASLWMCSTSTYSNIEDTRMTLSLAIPTAALNIAAVAEHFRSVEVAAHLP